MRHLLVILGLVLLPSFAQAATVDLSIPQGSISFSDELISGNTVRIYAEVRNEGGTDVSGYVAFFQGSLPIGDSQVISVRSGGLSEEVYVDFVVPSGDFNIRAEIRGTDPSDGNASNDFAITKLYTPIVDDDGDGEPNATDNCPSASNASQTDSDGDGEGNACDDDDDDDGMTDAVESELGTDPTDADTDGDGTDDASDAYPTDATRTVVPPPPALPVAPSASAVPADPLYAPQSAPVPDSTPEESPADSGTQPAIQPTDSTPSPESTDSKPDDDVQQLSFSPKAIFQYARERWNTFTFTAVTPESPGTQYQWDFGDGVTSSRGEVRHTFGGSGEYEVRFRVSDAAGTVSEDSAVVRVRFWTLENRLVTLLLGALLVALVAGLAVVARLFRRGRAAEPAASSTNGVEAEDAALDATASRKIPVRALDED